MRYGMSVKLAIPLLLGVSGVLLWFSWSWFSLAACLQIIAALLLLRDLWSEGRRFIQTAHPIVTCVFVVLMILYAVPVFLPETGFDALWYHLPITEVFSHSHVVKFIPELYQSAMPRLGSFIFTPSYVVGGVIGVKIFVYFIILAGISWVYRIARFWFQPRMAAFLTICIFSFHVFGWQSSSAYVDQVRFYFEIAAIWIFLQSSRSRSVSVVGAILFGLALSTKLIALFFFPAVLIWLLVEYGWRFSLRVCCITLLVVAPWYVQAYQWTGNPLYPLFQQLNGQELFALAGVTSEWKWVGEQLLKLPFLPLLLATNLESYTSPLFVLTYASLLRKKIVIQPSVLFVLISGVILLCILPFSFRYAWAAMVIFFLLLMKHHHNVYAKNRVAMAMFIVVGFCGIVFQVFMRMGVAYRALPVLRHTISEQEYLRMHETPLIFGPLVRWYSGYWHSYAYPIREK